MNSKRDILLPARPHSGFTLIEITFALLVLMLLAIGMTAFFAVSTKTQNSSRNREIARMAATSMMEEVLAWPDYPTLVTQFNGATFDVGSLQGQGGNPPGSVTVDDTDPALLEVTVIMAWVNPEGNQSFELSTWIAEP